MNKQFLEQFLDEWLNENLTQRDLDILKEQAQAFNVSLKTFVVRILEMYADDCIIKRIMAVPLE